MECKRCGSKWDSQMNTGKCPFCGAVLSSEDVTDIVSVITTIANQYGQDAFIKSTALPSYIADIAPNLSDELYFIRLCSNAGISKELYQAIQSNKKGQQSACEKSVAMLTDKYALDEKKASEIIDWYAKALNLTYDHKEEKQNNYDTNEPIDSVPIKVDNTHNADDTHTTNSTKKTHKKVVFFAAVSVLCLIAFVCFFVNSQKTVDTTQSGSSQNQINETEENVQSSTPIVEAETTKKPVVNNAFTLIGTELGKSNVDATRDFEASNTIDGNLDSCWCVNTNSTGAEGAALKIVLSEKSYVSGIRIVNGNLYMVEDELYKLNGQIKSFTLSFSDGSEQSFSAEYNDGDKALVQSIQFQNPINTEYIVLTVNSSYVGSKFATNTCLTEIELF